MSNKTKATLLVIVCIIFWAMIPVVAKLAQVSLDNHQFLFWSSLISFICLFSTAIIKKKIEFIKSYSFKDWLILITLGLLGTYIYYLFLYLGYKEAKGLEVLVIQYTWPISIVFLSLFILNERLTIQKSISIILGFVGVLFVLTKGNFSQIHLDNIYVILLVFLGATSFALFSVLSKKVKYEPIGAISIYFLSATIASFFSMNYFSSFAIPTSNELLPILLNGIIINGFSYLFWINALRLTQASYLAPFTFLTPILSAVYLIVIFNEPIQTAYVIGLVFVVIAGLVNSF
jgi:drug/metabolite transporter (DMT)-like permease